MVKQIHMEKYGHSDGEKAPTFQQVKDGPRSMLKTSDFIERKGPSAYSCHHRAPRQAPIPKKLTTRDGGGGMGSYSHDRI